MRWHSRRSELALGWLGYALGAMAALGTSTGFFAASASMDESDGPQILAVMLWIIFLIWQFAPILFSGYSPGLNFREIARYPLTFRLYFLLNAAYGMFEPAALAGCLWLFSLWLGLLFSHPEWALPAALVFLVFVAFNVVGNRILVALFDRFQSTRKGRERVAVLLLVMALVPQMIQFTLNGWIDLQRFHPPQWLPHLFTIVLQLSPPGLVSAVIVRTGAQKLLPFAILLGYLLLAAGLLVRSLLRVYHGEVYAETFQVKRDLKVTPGWKLPLLDESTSAIVEKELRYLRENMRLLVQLFYPLIIFGFLLLGGPGRRMPFISNSNNLLASFAGLMALSASNLSYNTFGMDREGFGRWLLAPLSLRRVLIAKSVAQGLIMTAIYAAGAIVIVLVRHVPWTALVAISSGFFCVLIIQISAGSVISVHWPKKIELTQMSTRMASQAAGLASLAVTIPILLIIALVGLATWMMDLPWLPLAAGLVGLPISLKIYSVLINRAVSYAEDHLEEITEKLGA